MIKRTLGTYLLRDARYYPVLTLTGPRQSGKTMLARAMFPKHEYVTLEETDLRAFAKDDPRGFLKRYSGPVVIDEVQRAPDLLSHIQSEVDRRPDRGRFILTGSQNLALMDTVSQTLAGRSGILHLLPFSRAELEGRPQKEPAAPQKLFANQRTKFDCWKLIYTGFYPPIHDRRIPPRVWLSDYLRTYVERDVRALVNVGDLETFNRFLKLCAGRMGQLVNYSALASDGGISVDTARRWISVLKASFIIFLISPHHRNFNKRVIKCPKLYFHDTGLACHLLGISGEEQIMSHPMRGALFENYVVGEINKSYVHHRIEPALYFWRDQTGHEIDLLIDSGAPSAALHPVEIKSGSTVGTDMFAGLEWWLKLAGKAGGPPMLVYGGDTRYERRGIHVCPWFAV